MEQAVTLAFQHGMPVVAFEMGQSLCEQGHGIRLFQGLIEPNQTFLFEGAELFQQALQARIKFLQAKAWLGAADPQQPVLVPGDPENAAMAERTRNGIPVPDNLVAQVRSIAQASGAAWLLQSGTK